MQCRHGQSPRKTDIQDELADKGFGKFGRMSFQPPPLFEEKEGEQQRANKALEDLGRAMISDQPEKNKNIPAGYTYLGQFIDHDITFDASTIGTTTVDPSSLQNFRTPRFDLDSLYGGGPKVQPYLYERVLSGREISDEGKFQLGKVAIRTQFPKILNLEKCIQLDKTLSPPDQKIKDKLNEQQKAKIEEVNNLLLHDLPRCPLGTALIADPRNDDNLIVAQLHLAFLKFHNKVHDEVARGAREVFRQQISEGDTSSDKIFEVARKTVIWHYQWIILYDFLPKVTTFCKEDIEQKVEKFVSKLDSRRSWHKFSDRAFIPVEFSAAAFRFGHSMLRGIYSINDVALSTLQDIRQFTGLSKNSRLREQKIFGDWVVDWRKLFPLHSPDTNKDSADEEQDAEEPLFPLFSHLINSKMLNPLKGEDKDPLSTMNLKRGRMLGLPSGQDLALAFGLQPLNSQEILESATTENQVVESTEILSERDILTKYGFHKKTPLWYYILKESEIKESGQRLGELGSCIVFDVFFRLLSGDKSSFLVEDPTWQPFLADRKQGEFTIADLISYVDEIDKYSTLQEMNNSAELDELVKQYQEKIIKRGIEF
ncbi:MAG: heme peroxidase family protein [Cyanobacteria bacterium P01_H01_bin.15]